jgi:hypothetical protein
MLLFFGGNVDDLRIFLTEERIPEGWENKVRSKKGLTIMSFNTLVNKVEFSIDERRTPSATADTKVSASTSALLPDVKGSPGNGDGPGQENGAGAV